MALVVLALAASMISNQVLGSSPVTIRYSTFTGGFGMIVGAIGAAALYLSFIPSLVPIALDALAGLFFLGGLIVRDFLLSAATLPSNPSPITNPSTNKWLTNSRKTGVGRRPQGRRQLQQQRRHAQ
jgi:hypothetical protein